MDASNTEIVYGHCLVLWQINVYFESCPLLYFHVNGAHASGKPRPYYIVKKGTKSLPWVCEGVIRNECIQVQLVRKIWCGALLFTRCQRLRTTDLTIWMHHNYFFHTVGLSTPSNFKPKQSVDPSCRQNYIYQKRRGRTDTDLTNVCLLFNDVIRNSWGKRRKKAMASYFRWCTPCFPSSDRDWCRLTSVPSHWANVSCHHRCHQIIRID